MNTKLYEINEKQCPYYSLSEKKLETPIQVPDSTMVVDKLPLNLCSHDDQRESKTCLLYSGKICNYLKDAYQQFKKTESH